MCFKGSSLYICLFVCMPIIGICQPFILGVNVKVTDGNGRNNKFEARIKLN